MRVPFDTNAEIIGRVADVDGDVYWCSKAKQTDHGFYIWFGWRQEQLGGPAKAVFTPELYEHMKAHDFSRKRSNVPISEGVYRRFRRRAGVVSPHDKDYREWKARNTPPPLILEDVDGEKFRVVSRQDTKLGVTLYQGTPLERLGNGRAIILTPALAAVIREWKGKPNVAAKLLGITHNPMLMLRKRLGIDYHSDINVWWGERLDDLLTLSSTEFVQKHGRTRNSVNREKVMVRRVIRMLQEPEAHTEMIDLIKADFGRGEKGIRKQLGSQLHDRLAPFRRAYKTLDAAGVLDRVDQLPVKPWQRLDAKVLDGKGISK